MTKRSSLICEVEEMEEESEEYIDEYHDEQKRYVMYTHMQSERTKSSGKHRTHRKLLLFLGLWL